jgi:integrase/recombinase XerC
VPLGDEASTAIDRYVRVRSKHRHARRPELWLGLRGARGETGLGLMLERRARVAGIDAMLNPHAWRHRWSHELRSAGVGDAELMSLAGWNSPAMLSRYCASAASERAREAHRSHSPADRL